MSKLVKLQERVVQVFKCKVCSYDVGVRVVCGVLNGTEIVYLILLGYNHDSTGMLTRRALYANAIRHYSVDLCARQTDSLFLKIFHNVTVGGLVSKRADRSRAEYVFRAEELLGVFMYLSLNLAREVKVYVGGFISVEAKECFKRNMMTVRLQLLTAIRTVFIWKVKSRANLVGVGEIVVSAIRTPVMRRQRVDLRNTRHRCNERRTDRSSRAYEIALLLTVPYKLLRYHIKNGKSVFDNRGQFSVKSACNYFGQRVAVHGFCSLVADPSEILLRTLHLGCKGALRERTYIRLDHIVDQIGIGYNHLVSLFLSEVGEFLKHLLGRAVINMRILVKVLELLTSKQYLAVKLVLLV